jgi:hypothetical protein
LDFSDTTVKEILPTYNKAEPRRNQYCQSSMIKSQNGIVCSVILLSFTNATAEHIIKIGTGLYILKPKYSDSGELMEYPVSYVKAKYVNTTNKADGNVFVLRAVIVCFTATLFTNHQKAQNVDSEEYISLTNMDKSWYYDGKRISHDLVWHIG